MGKFYPKELSDESFGLLLDDDAQENYGELREIIYEGKEFCHQLFGFPATFQDDEMERSSSYLFHGIENIVDGNIS